MNPGVKFSRWSFSIRFSRATAGANRLASAERKSNEIVIGPIFASDPETIGRRIIGDAVGGGRTAATLALRRARRIERLDIKIRLELARSRVNDKNLLRHKVIGEQLVDAVADPLELVDPGDRVAGGVAHSDALDLAPRGRINKNQISRAVRHDKQRAVGGETPALARRIRVVANEMEPVSGLFVHERDLVLIGELIKHVANDGDAFGKHVRVDADVLHFAACRWNHFQQCTFAVPSI